MDFDIGASPHPEIVLSKYEPGLFPKFRIIFESAPPDNLVLHHLVRPPEEALTAVVMENRSTRDITGLRYFLLDTTSEGNVRTRKQSSDSYYLEHYHPVLRSRDCKLILGSVTIDESFLDHISRGGGGIGSGMSGRVNPQEQIVATRFEIDMLLFEDGEIAGRDIDKYAAELSFRKRAAEFVLRQVRLAEEQGRDVSPVMSALSEMPRMRDDFLGRWIQRFSSQVLRSIGNEQMWHVRVRHLEMLPALPNFYRRPES